MGSKSNTKRKFLVGLAFSIGIASASLSVGSNMTAVAVEAASQSSTESGWQTVSGKKYYYVNGTAVTGFKTIDGKRYYFGSNGVLKTGWFKVNGNYYCANGSGCIKVGWQKFTPGNSSHYSYFNNGGMLITGWRKINNIYYYFDGKGWMKTGWQTISGHKYYFNSKGHMTAGTTVTLSGVKYTFNGKGWLTGTAEDASNWTSGVASAYGGSSDTSCGTLTANGSTVSDSSMGVAIPLSWGRRDLLGHKVKIYYNGKVVTATINDLGGMGGGSRSLDLQPGVFKAFGASDCDSWGLRTVKYKIL